MNASRRGTYLVGAVMLLAPCVVAQMQSDPTANPGPSAYPQSPQNMNSPAGPQGSNQSGAQVGTPGSMRDSLPAPGQTGQQMLDKQFLRAAAEGGVADVKMATLAVQKGSTPGVKDLAQKMLDDHTTINKDLAGVADEMSVMLPKKMNKDDQAEYDKLNGLTGKDFDTEYVVYTARTHWMSLHAFYMEASAAADQDLQAEVVKALGTMHEHMGLIGKTAKAEGITLPPRPQRPAATTTASK